MCEGSYQNNNTPVVHEADRAVRPHSVGPRIMLQSPTLCDGASADRGGEGGDEEFFNRRLDSALVRGRRRATVQYSGGLGLIVPSGVRPWRSTDDRIDRSRPSQARRRASSSA